MKYFSSKWTKFKKHEENLTASAAVRIPNDSNGSASPLGILKKGHLNHINESLINDLNDYLSDKIELAPVLFVTNVLTYFVEEETVYKHFRLWRLNRGQTVPTRDLFHIAMLRLFPEPGATFNKVSKTWHNFAFHSEGIKEDDLRIKHAQYFKKQTHVLQIRDDGGKNG
jgi:hypothetical protein